MNCGGGALMLMVDNSVHFKGASDPDLLDPHNFGSLDPDPKKIF